MPNPEPRVPRPYLQMKADELLCLAQNNWGNSNILVGILHELGYRRTRRAKGVQDNVTRRVLELQADSFKWPTTAAPTGKGTLFGQEDWFKKGLLKVLGYHVGKNARDEASRHQILDLVYGYTLPFTNSHEYMSLWGSPRTGTRLKKMAESIAAFARNAKRKQSSSHNIAIDHWEADLRYLKRKYYDGQYDFSWPTTRLR